MKSRLIKDFPHFTKAQLALLRRLRTPRKVQDFLDYGLRFNDKITDVCLSPLEVLKRRRAHCIEGAMLAAAAFLYHGRPSLLLDLRADASDDDHVIAPYVEDGKWGAVAQSQFCGLRFREPVYASFAELARSYFEFYYNDHGRKSLREFSVPLDTARLDPAWLHAPDVRFVSKKLDAIKHYRILTRSRERKLRLADSLLYEAEMLGWRKGPLSKRRARPHVKLPAAAC